MFKSKSGFTLAEMMVVMLILSIVLAAMAPVMTTRNKTDYSSPWRYASNGSDAYFAGNSNSNQVAMIGQHEVGTGEDNARLILRTSSGSGWSHLMFKTGDTIVGRLYLDESNLYLSNVTNPSGSESTSVGVGALTQNTGENNTAIGNEALHNNTSGIMNTAIGSFSLRDTNTGSNNIGVGTFSLTENTTGSGNVAIGTNALQHNTTGTDNIAIGTNAASDELPEAYAKTISLGYQSLALGNGSISIGSSMTSGEQHGSNALNGAYTVGLRSIAIGVGSQAGRIAGSASLGDSIAIGTNAIANVNSAIAIGNTTSNTGSNSVTIGRDVTNTGFGSNSIAIGNTVTVENSDVVALGHNVSSTASGSVVIGNEAQSDGLNGIAIGNGAKSVSYQYGGSRGNNIAIGTDAMGNATRGEYSIAIGAEALNKMNGTAGTAPNIGIGYKALMNLGTGADNLAVGFMALSNLVSGSSNVAIGPRACGYVTGTNKTCIGANSGPSSSDVNASNSDDVVYIGNDNSTVYIKGNIVVDGHVLLGLNKSSYVYLRTAHKGSNAVKNQSSNSVMALARSEDWHGDDDNFAKTYPNGLSSDGNAFFGDYLDEMKTVSDRRLKYVGRENTSGLDKIRQLKVFNYTFKKDEKKTPHVGVIAQDLQKVFPNAVKKGVDGFLTIRMEDMFYAVINAIKELDSRVTRLEKENQELKVRIERLEAKVK